MTPVPVVDSQQVSNSATFRQIVIEPCRPVILRGLCADWPVFEAAAQSRSTVLAYLTKLDAGKSAEVFVGHPSIAGRYFYGEELAGFNFERETLRLSDVLDRIGSTAGKAGKSTMYIGSLPTDQYLPGFADANMLVQMPANVRPRIWIGHSSVVACHHDNSDNLACVVAGHRRFTLFPPDAIGDLYVGPLDHTMAGQPVSLAVGSCPEDERYPRFEAARERALVAELSPGDALYMPKLWWHQVEAMSPFNILVNYWWDAFASGPDSPYTAMLLAMATMADRPAVERAAWRSFFEHYVFRGDGHPLAHLPSERHGLLAKGSQGRVRALVMKMLRGG